jgi:multicomponent Na+:H+ antiporter subunit E
MKPFFWNLLLALLWMFATGAFTFSNLVLGVTVGFLILFIAQRTGAPGHYAWQCWHIIRLGVYFLHELLMSTLRVMYDVLTPGHHMRAGIIAVPLDARTDSEITILASLITMTPGTLCLDVSTDRKVMYVHAMYVTDVEQFRQGIKQRLEKRVLNALR